MRIRPGTAAAVLLLASSVSSAQDVRQQLGVDPRVDYASLSRIGPWDDRNYQLTREDLALLADNEHELTEGIPAFYRVQLRRQYPDLLRTGKVQYPRSALPRFLIEYTGFRIDGYYYRATRREDGRWRVLRDVAVAKDDEGGVVRSLEGEVRITSPTGAAESSIEASPVNSDIVVAGSNGPGSGQKMHYSTDGGESWSQSSALPLGGTCCDPTIAWSSDGSLVYTATLGGNANYIYRSSDGGRTWNDFGADPRREVGFGGFVDKEFLHSDISPTSPFRDNLYLTWHESNIMRFAVSSDFGNTWQQQSFSSQSSQRGIGSDITTDAAGNVYYFWPAFNSRSILLRKSTDGGASFGPTETIANTQGSFTFPVPSMETRAVFIYVSADTDRTGGPFDGSIYAAWTDSTGPTSNNANNNHARIQVGYSRDGGNSWSTVTPHPTVDQNEVDRWHQWLTVDPEGRVHLIFYDTTGDPSRTSVNLYYTFSEDGAQSWSPLERLTSASSPNISDGFEFGDYNGLSATLDGVIASFTDNRNEGGGGGNSVDIYAAGKSFDDGGVEPGTGIGATSVGVSNVFALCLNVVTRQRVIIRGLNGEDTFDCTEAGFAASAGETAVLLARGSATCDTAGGECEIGAELTGISGNTANCRNNTTGQTVVVPLGGGTTLDCTAAGLTAAQGEQIQLQVNGPAE